MAAATYVESTDPVDLSGYVSPTTLLWVVISMSVASSLILAASFAMFNRLERVERLKLQQLVLSLLVVDERGRVLTTSQGMLPSAPLWSAYLGVGAFDELNHDFLRCMKASFRW